jgi:zinc transport system permease protein
VVVKRIVFISGSISHSIVLSGIGFLSLVGAKPRAMNGYLYKGHWSRALSPPQYRLVHLYYKQREDSVIALVVEWRLGF